MSLLKHNQDLVSCKEESVHLLLVTLNCRKAELFSASLLYFRGLLDDTSFHESVVKVTKDPIPVFAQIGDRKMLEDTPGSPATPPGSPVEVTTERVTEVTTTERITSPTTSVSSAVSSKKKSKSKSTSAASQRSKVS